ncbi:MAG: bifunctional diaminohydroxyphosphoribosylaminopyrimidine deaminase/5-amino-6-(5-phosphoribosylamino)uracil reductase RibD [Candidatus Omnitrophota bacterium]
MKPIDYMRMALELAVRAEDRTYPNPMVGAVIVRGGKVIGKGHHRKAGRDHAEVAAIKNVSGPCRGAEMFVTLEPCGHYGKTPPCTDAIIASGITAVNVAMKDPNPINSGRGIRKLKKAGIKVVTGLCAKEAAELNRKYVKFITEGRPYVTVKVAQSLDGKIAAKDGTSKWISSAVSRGYVKKMRPAFDGIMIGINTALKDDPFLLDEKKKGYDTARVVVDTRLKLPTDSNLIRTAGKAPVIIGTTGLAPASRIKKFRKIKNVEVIVTRSRKGRVPLDLLMEQLARRGMVNVLAEGGGELIGGLMDGGLIDEVVFFISPCLIGGGYSSVRGRGVQEIAKAVKLDNIEISESGGDIMVRARIRK